jgi:hypothetical protein
MFIYGLIIGIIALLFTGLFHPLIIYGEYHFGTKIWPFFLAVGLILCITSLCLENIIISSSCGIIGFYCFWSIHELFRQKQRVERGWFPKKKQ